MVCLQQMETNASINLSPSWVLCSLYHDSHTNIILSFDTNTYCTLSQNHKGQFQMRMAFEVLQHLFGAPGMTSSDFMYPQGSLKILKSIGLTLELISFHDPVHTAITRAQLWGPLRMLSRGSSLSHSQNHAGPQNQTRRRNTAERQSRLGCSQIAVSN